MILSPNFISYTHLNQLILYHESIEIKQRPNLPIFKFKCQLMIVFFYKKKPTKVSKTRYLTQK